MTSPWTLRRARPDDIGFICDAQEDPEISRYVGTESAAEHLENLNDPSCAYLICEDTDRRPAGYAILQNITGAHNSIELQRIAVTRRGTGIGGAMLALIKHEAFERHGANRLWLDVFPENALARAAYKRAGFVEEGTLREHYFWQGGYRSVVIMSVLRRDYDAAGRAT